MTHAPGPTDEVLYLGGPLAGQDAEPGNRRLPWPLYRYETGNTAPASYGDREFCRGLENGLID